MARWHRAALLALVAAASLLGTATGSAAPLAAGGRAPHGQAGAITLSARAGFDGYYKDGRWVPMRITVANDGPDVRGTLRVVSPRSNGADVILTRNVELSTQSRREVFMYIPTEGFVSNLKVSLVDGRTTLASAAQRVVQAAATDLIYGVVAGSPSAFNILADVDPVNGSAFVAQLELGDLPPVGLGWQSLDVLVFSDVDTGQLTAEQRAALAGWIAGGGRLIVAGGPTWQKTASGLAPILPVSPSGTRLLTDLHPLAAFAAAATPGGSAVAATGELTSDAVVHAGEADVPLVVSRPSGFGTIFFLALDPAFEPLKRWDGLEGLLRNILAGSADRPSWSSGMRNWYSAREAVNALPNLALPSTLQICGFLGLYLAVVGPVNYLVLKRLNRRELAWLTIPAIVIVFSAAAYLTGYQLRGVQASLHRLAIVQVWPDSEWARVDEVVGLFSPRRADYDLAFGPGFLARPMPDSTLGAAAEAYSLEQTDSTLISGVRMEVGAVAPFATQGQVPAPHFEADVVLEVVGGVGQLSGSVTNRSDLSLVDVVVLAPGGAQRLGDLPPGETAAVGLSLQNSRATPASTNNVLPVIPRVGTTPVLQPYSPPSTYDTTIDDILGNTNYYSDRRQYRRYSLLSSIIEPYAGSMRGSGVYLVGWSDRSPSTAQVVNRAYDVEDSALYFVALRPTLSLGDEFLTIPPGMMTWSVLDPGQTGTPMPYDMYLYQGSEFALRFAPTRSLPFNRVRDLTLHLTSYGMSGLAGVRVALWDFSEGVWANQPSLFWGDNRIQAPERFVGPAGEIHVRVANPSSPQVSIQTLDFTLLVDPQL